MNFLFVKKDAPQPGYALLFCLEKVQNNSTYYNPLINGIGIISQFVKLTYQKYASSKPFVADIINEDEFDLKEFEIDSKIISTLGHTSGSQSVLIGSSLISGNTFINLKNGTIFPHFADDPKLLL